MENENPEVRLIKFFNRHESELRDILFDLITTSDQRGISVGCPSNNVRLILESYHVRTDVKLGEKNG